MADRILGSDRCFLHGCKREAINRASYIEIEGMDTPHTIPSIQYESDYRSDASNHSDG